MKPMVFIKNTWKMYENLILIIKLLMKIHHFHKNPHFMPIESTRQIQAVSSWLEKIDHSSTILILFYESNVLQWGVLPDNPVFLDFVCQLEGACLTSRLICRHGNNSSWQLRHSFPHEYTSILIHTFKYILAYWNKIRIRWQYNIRIWEYVILPGAPQG